MAIFTTLLTGRALSPKTITNYTAERPLRVLMVGNSYSMSCARYLPKVAASVPGCALKFEVAYIGGCSLERHVNEYQKSVENPDYRPYQDITWQPASLPELLSRDTWDIISIQQASHLSWNYSTYQPWADKLISIIRQTNPQAEIVIQQTWSYNGGDSRISDPESGWKFDQEGMYQRLAEAYQALADATGFRIVPMGRAVQLTRRNNPEQFPADLQAFIQKLTDEYPVGTPLPWAADAVGNIFRDSENNVCLDTIHLNPYGEYLQACVWFGFLFNRSPLDIEFHPTDIPNPERLMYYRECAVQALKNN